MKKNEINKIVKEAEETTKEVNTIIEELKRDRERYNQSKEIVQERAGRINKELWDKYLNAGYKLAVGGSCKLYRADALLQKAIWENGVKLYFITIWVYLWDEQIPNYYHEHRIALQPQVQFNTHSDNKPTFNVDYMGDRDDPEEVELFFKTIYERMECEPYGD